MCVCVCVCVCMCDSEVKNGQFSCKPYFQNLLIVTTLQFYAANKFLKSAHVIHMLNNINIRDHVHYNAVRQQFRGMKKFQTVPL